MRKANVRVVELDDAFVNGRLQRLQHSLAVSIRCRDELDRRPGERRGLEQDIAGVGRQAVETAAEQLAQAVGNAQGLSRRRPRVRAHELAPQLERKERITGRRLLHAGELWSGQLEPEPLLEQTMQRAERERAEREPLQPLFREEAARARGHSRPRAPA